MKTVLLAGLATLLMLDSSSAAAQTPLKMDCASAKILAAKAYNRIVEYKRKSRMELAEAVSPAFWDIYALGSHCREVEALGTELRVSTYGIGGGGGGGAAADSPRARSAAATAGPPLNSIGGGGAAAESARARSAATAGPQPNSIGGGGAAGGAFTGGSARP